MLDRRNIVTNEDGNFVGPTILFDVTTDLECCKVDSSEEAINIIIKSKYGNGAYIYLIRSHCKKVPN